MSGPSPTADGRPPIAGEAAVVRRARAGDTGAFASLVRDNQDRVYRLALRMVGPDAAEDVAQQVLLKAWQGLARFDGKAAFGTWLYRIAVNQCLDELRRAARFRPLPLDDIDPADPSGEDVEEDTVMAAEQEERRAALAWALEQIPSEDRLLLHLRVGEERSYDEIAGLLQTNVRTVGTRLYRARARLHRLIVQRL